MSCQRYVRAIEELHSEVADLRKILSVPVASDRASTNSTVGFSSDVVSAPTVEKLFTTSLATLELKAGGVSVPCAESSGQASMQTDSGIDYKNNKRIKSVNTKISIDVFVSRLHQNTSLSEIEDCIKEENSDGMLIHAVHCEKLKSRYEHLYMSSRVQIEIHS